MNTMITRFSTDFVFYSLTTIPLFTLYGYFLGKRRVVEGLLCAALILPVQVIAYFVLSGGSVPTTMPTGFSYPWWVQVAVWTPYGLSLCFGYLAYRYAKRPPKKPAETPTPSLALSPWVRARLQ